MRNISNSSKLVLHITPHLGGGVGAVILNYLRNQDSKDYSHEIICLDYANENSIHSLDEINIPLKDNMQYNHKNILSDIKRADIVLIHFWNHPLLYDFLVRNKLPKCRLIIWSHISGLCPPSTLPQKILNYPDLFVFTSPISFESHGVLISTKITDHTNRNKKDFRVVWSTSGVERFASLKRNPHEGINIGYIGTLDYSKMHPNFLEMHSRIEIEKCKFFVIGGGDDSLVREQALPYGDKFTFTGSVSNITPYIQNLDILGYPLARWHFGTCEQVIGECMALGVPPVVLDNLAERSIVEHGVTGLIAKDENEYVLFVESLALNPELRTFLGENAKLKATTMYSTELMINRWRLIFEEIIEGEKTKKEWSINVKKITPSDVFLESLGGYSCYFTEGTYRILYKSPLYGPLWRSKTKGTALHYSSFFPKDSRLKKWSEMDDSKQ